MNKLDMALDDIKNDASKRTRKNRSNPSGGNRNNLNTKRGRFNNRRGGGRGGMSRPYSKPQVPRKPKTLNLKRNKRVLISNLCTDFVEEEIWEVFEQMEFGKSKLRSLTVNYTKEGKFNGSCIVEFITARDAEDCVKEWDGALIEKKEVYLDFIMSRSELMEDEGETEAPAASNGGGDYYDQGNYGYYSNYQDDYQQGYGYRGRRGRGSYGRGRGRGGRGNRGPKKTTTKPKPKPKPTLTKEDLDKQLDEMRKKEEKAE